MKVQAMDLLHEGGQTYKKDEVFEIDAARGKRLIEIGICRAVAEPPSDPDDKMMRGKKG